MNRYSSFFQPTNSMFLLVGAILPIVLGMYSCENNLEVIRNITKSGNTPTLVRYNTEISYSDSARLKVKIYAVKLEHFSQNQEPYILFPEGMKVEFYDDSARLESIITSKFARYDEKKKLWEARNDVVAKNLKKGEQLNTEELFWDESRELIYSVKLCRVTTPTGTAYGEEGIEAGQDFSWYVMKGIRNSNFEIEVEDEE